MVVTSLVDVVQFHVVSGEFLYTDLCSPWRIELLTSSIIPICTVFVVFVTLPT